MYLLFSASSTFPTHSIITIERGSSLEMVASSFEETGVVRSALFLRLLVSFSGNANNVIAGDYFFDSKRGVIFIAYAITHGQFNLNPIKVTVAEGASVVDIAEQFSELFPKFDPEQFLKQAQNKEGYLFPDTYYFFPNVDVKTVLSTFEQTFKKRTAELDEEIKKSPYSLDDIVIMASIIEREANTPESRRIISGILWRRIAIGMPLQVDVTFKYINGKSTFDLTKNDLAIDSPYNTYRYIGLPPGPIGSPGLDSIEAALNPTSTPYLYFLADHSGNVYYSKTFDEHKEKKQLYLN